MIILIICILIVVLVILVATMSYILHKQIEEKCSNINLDIENEGAE